MTGIGFKVRKGVRMMPDKDRNKENKYIIDKLRGHRKKEYGENIEGEEKSTENIEEKTTEIREVKSAENEDIADMELGCYFFLILPFIASILFLIILIALLR